MTPALILPTTNQNHSALATSTAPTTTLRCLHGYNLDPPRKGTDGHRGTEHHGTYYSNRAAHPTPAQGGLYIPYKVAYSERYTHDHYTGYDTDGKSYSGIIKITVGSTDVDTVTYETGKNETVVFDGDDFNKVCDDGGYETLNYIKITTLPSTSYGKLYYGYASSSSKGTAVATSTKLYYKTSSTPYLDKVAFVPASGYTGTVTISYTGYDTDGESYSGSIKITVASISDITITTPSNAKVTFSVTDFNTVCSSATGENLSYVKFTLPSSSYGKLYYNYTSSTSYTSPSPRAFPITKAPRPISPMCPLYPPPVTRGQSASAIPVIPPAEIPIPVLSRSS